MKKYIIAIIIVLGILLSLFGSYYIYSSNNSQNDTETLKSKTDEEITYLDTTIVSLMNGLNNITYSNYKVTEEVTKEDKNSKSNPSVTNMNMNYNSILVRKDDKINWDDIKKEIEKMYSTWNTVLIDLNALNVNQDDLLKYTSVLDNVTIAVQKEDKKSTLFELANLYSLLAKYAKQYSKNDKKINLLDTKANVLDAYVLIEDERWDNMKNSIQKAQNSYNNIINSNLQTSQYINTINKAYILLNEMLKSINTKDKDIFYINYKNLMHEIDIINT